MKIVLTGGPCAGKTTLTHIFGRVFASQVIIVPETASLLFGGGFPRWQEGPALDAAQRAIYHVQCEIEAAHQSHFVGRSMIMDRGTLDGAAYWSSGIDHFFAGIGTTIERELARYDHVIYLESADEQSYHLNKSKNPNRVENWETARQLDKSTRDIWSKHSSFSIIPNHHSFDVKIVTALELVGKLLKIQNKTAA